MAAVYDFNSQKTKREAFADALTKLVDEALERVGAANERPRSYLGASQIGDPCLRRIQYDLRGQAGEDLGGKTRRIFDRGNTYEDKAAQWLRAAGFVVQTHNQGRQFGFVSAKGQFRGHIDGIVHEGPAIEGLTYPCIWENKCLGAKGWKSIAKDGVAKAYPQYADQVAVYQFHLDHLAPALFTAVNADTMEIHAELVAFDPVRAQNAIDRAVTIIRAEQAGELLPKVSNDPSQFPCPWCRYKSVCHA